MYWKIEQKKLRSSIGKTKGEITGLLGWNAKAAFSTQAGLASHVIWSLWGCPTVGRHERGPETGAICLHLLWQANGLCLSEAAEWARPGIKTGPGCNSSHLKLLSISGTKAKHFRYVLSFENTFCILCLEIWHVCRYMLPGRAGAFIHTFSECLLLNFKRAH